MPYEKPVRDWFQELINYVSPAPNVGVRDRPHRSDDKKLHLSRETIHRLGGVVRGRRAGEDLLMRNAEFGDREAMEEGHGLAMVFDPEYPLNSMYVECYRGMDTNREEGACISYGCPDYRYMRE